jgi:hypothetical protein
MIESFWSRMQVELLDRRRWRTRLGLASAIVEQESEFSQCTGPGAHRPPYASAGRANRAHQYPRKPWWRFALSRWAGRSCPATRPQGEAVTGESQRLSDPEQLEILALLEVATTEHSAMRAARALAELMGRLHILGQRIAGELPDQDRNLTPAER